MSRCHKLLLPSAAPLMLAGCALFTPLPPPTTTQERIDVLASMPAPKFEKAVSIYWSSEKIPFIEAQTDADAARALGLVHAHLRLGQMEVFKRVASGRVAEMLGRRATKIDAAIRALNFYRTASDVLANMPESTREWLAAYVEGINHYKQNMPETPHDMVIAVMENEPWTLADTIGTGKLIGADISWFVLLRLLGLRDKENWPRVWSQLAVHQKETQTSFPMPPPELGEFNRTPDDDMALFTSVFEAFTRSGSNSIALAGERSKSGAPILVNEPHLSFVMPNFWMVVGIKSPSYHAVGLMAPGIPLIALGRNPHISWGGTNMRNYASDIVEVSGEPMTEEVHKIGRRVARDTTVQNRLSKFGPVISDAGVFPFPENRDFAVRWVGHLPSDELSAYLGVMRATGWRALKEAMASYAVPGQNMLFADKDGTIGQLSAAWLPARGGGFPEDLWIGRERSDRNWQNLLTVDDLPSVINPADGVVASTNNRPAENPPTRISWFYPRDDRIRRVYELIQTQEKWDIDGLLSSVSADTYSRAHHRLNGVIVEMMAGVELDEDARATLEVLERWDGHFATDSKGAYVHLGLLTEFSPEFYEELDREDELDLLWRSTFLPQQLEIDIGLVSGFDVGEMMAEALDDAHSYVRDDKRWGDVHRVRVSHIAGMSPIGGKKYRLYELPIPGGMETLMKSSHPLTVDEHFTSFGTQSRHYSDMSDDDENYFALFGGQDGWLNSENFADQVPLWAEDRMIRVPLRIESVRSHFPYRTDFPAFSTQQ